MANVKLVVNPFNVTNHVIIRVERVDNLGVLVDSQTFAPPHTQRNITFANLDPVMYRFFFWESSDGIAYDTNIGSADIDASLAFESVIEVFELSVGGAGANDPAADQNEYHNTALAGCDILTPGVTAAGPVYTVNQRAIGPKLVSELENIPTGGFKILGDVFYLNDVWIVYKYSKIVAPAGPTPGAFPSDWIDIAATVTALDSTHLNKGLALSASAPVQMIQFPDLGSLADKKFYVINTHQLDGNYAVLDFSNGGQLFYKGQIKTVFYMAVGEELGIMIKGGDAKVIFYNGNEDSRGRVVSDYSSRGPNYIQAIGQELTKAAYPGLYDFVLNLPDPANFTDWAASQVVDTKTVYPNKGRWALDVATEKIKVPDLRNMSPRFLKLAADAERISNFPGGYQIDKFKAHKHTGTYKQGKSDDNESGVSGEYLRKPGAAGGSNYGNITVDALSDTGGIETRGENVGFIPLITL